VKRLVFRGKKIVGAGKKVAGALLKGYAGFDVSSLDLGWLIATEVEGAIVCFDDLERCEMPMKEILGYINRFVEHCGSSVIVICNEAEIESDEDRREQYGRMREKTVGHSIAYRPEHHEVLVSLAEQYRQSDAPFHQYLSQNQELIGDLFAKSETDNIRAMQRALNALQKVFDALCEGGIDAKFITKQLVYAVVPTSLELHVGRGDPDALRRIHSRTLMLVAAAFAGMAGDTKTYEKEFADRYLIGADAQHAVGFPALCEYLITGYLDRESLIAQMKRQFLPTDCTKPYERLLADPMVMEDAEFRTVADQIFGEVREGKVTAPGALVGLFDAFQTFAEHGLVSHTREELVQVFDAGLQRCSEQGTYEADTLFDEVVLSHPSLESPTEVGKVFRSKILEVNEAALQLKRKRRVLEAAAKMERDAKHFISQLVSSEESGLRYTPVFDKLDADEVANWVLRLPNGLKRRLQFAIKARYDSLPPDEGFVAEVSALEKIRDGLRKHSDQSPDGKSMPVGQYLVQRLADLLDRAITQIHSVRSRLQGHSQASSEDHADGEG